MNRPAASGRSRPLSRYTSGLPRSSRRDRMGKSSRTFAHVVAGLRRRRGRHARRLRAVQPLPEAGSTQRVRPARGPGSAFSDLGGEALGQQLAGRLGVRCPARAGRTARRRRSCPIVGAVAALHVVGVDLELRLGVRPRRRRRAAGSGSTGWRSVFCASGPHLSTRPRKTPRPSCRRARPCRARRLRAVGDGVVDERVVVDDAGSPVPEEEPAQSRALRALAFERGGRSRSLRTSVSAERDRCGCASRAVARELGAGRARTRGGRRRHSRCSSTSFEGGVLAATTGLDDGVREARRLCCPARRGRGSRCPGFRASAHDRGCAGGVDPSARRRSWRRTRGGWGRPSALVLRRGTSTTAASSRNACVERGEGRGAWLRPPHRAGPRGAPDLLGREPLQRLERQSRCARPGRREARGARRPFTKTNRLHAKTGNAWDSTRPSGSRRGRPGAGSVANASATGRRFV